MSDVTPSATPSATLCAVAAKRFSTHCQAPIDEQLQVIREAMVTLDVHAVNRFSFMCTPCQLEALAVGFAYAEGLLVNAHDVASLSVAQTSSLAWDVALRLANPPTDYRSGQLCVTSSSGLCGPQQLAEGKPVAGNNLRLPWQALVALAREMSQRQTLFHQAGGSHAALLFDAQAQVLGFAEDIGRHNAMDKVIGQLLLRNVVPRGGGVLLSGRISLEIVTKAARAGLEIVAGVSAPSSLAVAAANRQGLTLCGFVREDRATAYTHAQRLVASDE